MSDRDRFRNSAGHYKCPNCRKAYKNRLELFRRHLGGHSAQLLEEFDTAFWGKTCEDCGHRHREGQHDAVGDEMNPMHTGLN